LTVPPDPALVGGTDSFSSFTTHFGVENAEVIPVGIVPELMDDASSSYEYQPPEEGHAFEGNGEAESVSEETKSEDVAQSPTPVAVSSTAGTSWEMVPVEAEGEASAPIAATPEEPPTEAVAEPTSVREERAIFEQASAAIVEESAPDAHAIEAAVVESPAIEPAEKPFDPDATQALPEEFFTSSEPQLETTAELVGASIPEPVAETVVEPATEPATPVVEESAIESSWIAPVIESPEPTTFTAKPEPPVEAHPTPVELPAQTVTSVATEPAILSVGPEPPSIVEEPEIQPPRVEAPHIEMPSVAAAAAAGAGALGAAIAEQLHHVPSAASEAETAPGDQTQVFIASAVARVLDRMKPTLIEEIAREMSNRRKPRKDPEE
jgi:hypothetical protein